jgi:hypothetical protein
MAVVPVVSSERSSDALVLSLEQTVTGWPVDDPESPPRPRTTEMSVAPNPFNPTTEIRFTLSKAGWVSLEIYDVGGHVIRTLIDENRVAGEYSAVWDGRDGMGRTQSSGTYLARLKTSSVQLVERMTLLK